MNRLGKTSAHTLVLEAPYYIRSTRAGRELLLSHSSNGESPWPNQQFLKVSWKYRRNFKIPWYDLIWDGIYIEVNRVDSNSSRFRRATKTRTKRVSKGQLQLPLYNCQWPQIVTVNLYFPELSPNVMEFEQQSRKAGGPFECLPDRWMWHLHEMKSTHGKRICSHFLFHSFPQHLKASMHGAGPSKKIQVSRIPSCPYWSLGPKHHVCRHRSSWGTSISACFEWGNHQKSTPIHQNKNKLHLPRWLNLPVEDCTERHTFAFFLKISSPFFWGSKNHPCKILSRAPLRGVAIAIFLLDW